MFDSLKERGFEVKMLHHAEAILRHDMPKAVDDIGAILANIVLAAEELVRSGGGEGQLTQRLRRQFAERGWLKHNFQITKSVDGEPKESVSHEIDHVKRFESGTFALEIEWNNKDPFFDRDLENFKRLHADAAISVGGIVTRGSSLHQNMREIVREFALRNGIDAIEKLTGYDLAPTKRQQTLILKAADQEGDFAAGWARVFVSDKFGEATTHWAKLEARLHRGVGNPCPLVLIGLPASIVTY